MSNRSTRRRQAIEGIDRCERLLVALSGGVDSAVLLALAREALGAGRVLAATAVSDAVPALDVNDARGVARYLEVEHVTVSTHELAVPAYRANTGDRCFHCRDEMFDVLAGLARRRGIPAVAYGAIRDDLGDERPGMEAARRHGVLAPLLDAGMGKEDVRAIARELALPVADKPAAACLASRIPVGTEVSEERLRQIETAEAGLRRLGFAQIRVRHHGSVARIELDSASIALLAQPILRGRVSRVVRAAGFRHVAIDLDGYRAGSLNVVASETGPTRRGGQ